MNAVILIGLCALGANAQFFPYNAYSAYTPNFYTPNLLHSGAFSHAVGSPITYTLGNAYAPAFTYAAAPVAPVQTQHHAQDELGQFNFGYSGGPSSRHETRDMFGTVRGAFNYIDGDGKVQHQSYVADAAGFRVAATNLPVAPEVPSGADTIYLNPPKPVEDTPAVATAKAAHEKLFNKAAAAAAAAPDASPSRKKRSTGSVAIHSAVSPLTYTGFNAFNTFTPHAVAPAAVAPAPVTYAATGFNYGYAAGYPTTYTAGNAYAPAFNYGVSSAVTYNAALPAALSTHDSTLLRVENNPGHAVSYRVY